MTEAEKKIEQEVLEKEVDLEESELMDVPPVVIDETAFDEVVQEEKQMLTDTDPESAEESKTPKQLKAEEKQLKAEEKQLKKAEKKEARAVIKKERLREIKSLLRTAEAAMLLTYIVLAIDQVGLYGFVSVWLFISVMVASIAVLLLGIIRSTRQKRSGIIFFVAAVGIILCAAWFIFLILSQGLGIGPVPQ